MNGRKKLLCTFLVAFFLFCYTSVNVFAEPTGTSSVDSPSSAAGAPSAENKVSAVEPSTSEPAAPAQTAQVSSAPPPSSAAPSSAPSSRRTRRTAVSSDAASSDLSGFVSSEIVSSEVEASSAVISLPGVGSVAETDPLGSVSSGVSSWQMNRIGILAWVCIGLGVLVVLIVILSNRRPPRGPGRRRYRRTKRSSKKRLLNDRYYRGLNRY